MTASFANRHLLGSAEVLALTGGALRWATRSERDFPDVLAIGTLECSHFGHFYYSSFNSEGHALDQYLGHLFPGRLDNPTEGLPGHAHPFRRFFLIEPLVVGQSQCLVFVYCEFHFLQCPPRHTRWLQKGEIRQRCDSSAAFWSWHVSGSY
jgi:hypothetical protein